MNKVTVQSTNTEQAQQKQRSRGSTNSLLFSSFLPRNRRRQQGSAQKAVKDAKPERLLQTEKENGERKKPNEKKEQQKKKTPSRTKRPITIQILQRKRRQRQKQKNVKITLDEEKLLKIKFTSKGPALFGNVQNLSGIKNFAK